MGQEFCKGCIRTCKTQEEEDFSNSQNNIFDFNNNYKEEKKNNNKNIYKNDIQNNNLIYRNLSLKNAKKNKKQNNNCFTDTSGIKNTNYQEENETKEEIINKTKKEELNKIIYKYKLKLIYNFFIKVKKAKQDSHKEIYILKKSKDIFKSSKNNKINKDTDLNLFPIEEYEYIGNKFKHFKDGFGIQKFYAQEVNINSSYIGYFRNDYRIKYCKYIDYINDYVYEGEIKFNLTGKYGIFKNNAKGLTYEGEWFNNEKEGYGIEKYRNESIYKGEFHNNKKNGIGFLKWEDGSTYEGNFVNNYLHGYGLYIFKEGSYYSGMWENGEMNGFGVYCFPNLEVYIGYHKNSEKSGFGIINWFNKNKIFIGFWKNNKQNGHGVFLLYGNIRYGLWKEGKKIEKYESFEEFKNTLNDEEKKYINIYKMDYNKLMDLVNKFINNDK